MQEERVLQGRYRLVRRMTQHGASSTYEAIDERGGARCVVKELSIGEVVRDGGTELTYDGDDFTKLIDLFEREARVLAHLDHPAIPRLVDHFQLEVDGDTRLYTVQELIEGQNLEQLIESGRHFTEEEAVAICRSVVEVLAHLHDRSPPLIHRDIKPSNIILQESGGVFLVDFGSVRNVRDVDGLDGKTIVGTYGYMPIEQYEARAVPQSDFYALGMTLVYMLSHKDPTRIPRTGMTLDFRPHVNVSERLAGLIEWMIQPAPEQRPSSAAVILEALDPNFANLPELFRSAPVTSRPTHAMTSVRVASLIVGVLFVLFALARLFVVGGVGVTADADPPPPTLRPVRPELPPSPPAVVAEDGVLTIQLDEDFSYVPDGWPMGRSVAQTRLPALTSSAPRDLRVPSIESHVDVLYGRIPLGNTDDRGVDFALLEDEGVWSVFLDRNNNGDLTDDGPALPNEGTGPLLATNATVEAPVRLSDGSEVRRPYALWIWFTEPSGGGTPYARMYARHHYAGVVEVDGRQFAATVFEYRDHDALYQQAGVCIDLNHDRECAEETELFRDGDLVRTAASEATLVLDYP